MFEITYNDKEKLEKYIATRVAYLGGIYDFTFENTYIVYHWQNKDTSDYIAIDMRNGLSSNIIRVKNNRLYDENSYCKLIPYLLYSVKYNGEKRYYERITTNPSDVIDSIFRVVLANEGYSVREEQIALCKKMFNGFTKKQISICEAEVGTGKTLAYLVAGFVAKQYQMLNNGLLQPVTINLKYRIAAIYNDQRNTDAFFCIVEIPFNRNATNRCFAKRQRTLFLFVTLSKSFRAIEKA